MKLYIVINKDRHYDLAVEAFSDKTQAIEYARKEAHGADRFGDYEERFFKGSGLLFSAHYSCEGDQFCVVDCDLDEKLDEQKP